MIRAGLVLSMSLLGALPQLPILRPTNSRAAVKQGLAEFRKGEFAKAAVSFRQAVSLGSDPISSFDLGTAQVAAGDVDRGSVSLTEAMKYPQLKGAALYNRGNAALTGKAFDKAIRDYSEALRIHPQDKAAKRNLEIALRQQEQHKQREQQNEQQNEQQKNEQGSSQPDPDKPEQQQPNAPEEKKQSGGQPGQQKADPEALLRSVQDQEKEELSRMRRIKVGVRGVGW